jgi:ribosomal protein L7/L12
LETVLMIAIGCFVVGFFLGRSTAGSDKTFGNPTPIKTIGTLSGDVEDRVRQLIDRGQKIEALKEVRQATGMGLKQAKDYVDSIASQKPRPMIGSSASMGDRADAIGEVKNLVRSGKKIEAIKLYREISGVGLKQAKEEVERMERELT